MVTPFKGKNMGQIDHAALRKLTNFLIDGGVHALMVHGTSGEFLMQDREERKSAIATVVSETKKRVPVIAGISDASTKNAVALGKDAAEAGADAVISTGPIYYKTNDEGLYNHFQGIIDNIDLPLMIYNIPKWVGYDVPKETINKLIDKNPGRLVGVKFTTNDLAQFYEYFRLLGKKTAMMMGADLLIFSALELGAAGAVVGGANVLPREDSDIYENIVRGDGEAARKAQEKTAGFAEKMTLGTYPAALKEALRFLGLDCGEVRPPLEPLTAKQAAEVNRTIQWKKEETAKRGTSVSSRRQKNSTSLHASLRESKRLAH